MKKIRDTLEPLVEEWSDPGDYPNNVASGPLPSFKYLAGIEGELVLELDQTEYLEHLETVEAESLNFWMREVVDYRLPDGILSADWQLDKTERSHRNWFMRLLEWVGWAKPLPVRLTLSVFEAEGDPDWRDEPPEPDYDEDRPRRRLGIY